MVPFKYKIFGIPIVFLFTIGWLGMLFGENITAKVFVVDKIVQVEASMICLPKDILECIFNNIA